MRGHVAHGTAGRGHFYQWRFKSFPVQEDEHFLTVRRYVERKALTAGVLARAEVWRWGSLWAAREGELRLNHYRRGSGCSGAACPPALPDAARRSAVLADPGARAPATLDPSW